MLNNCEFSPHTLFVGSLSPTTDEKTLSRYFRSFGKLLRAKLIVDLQSNKSKQCALIFCPNKKISEKILNSYPHYLDGKEIRVNYAEESKKSTKSFTQNTLFLGHVRHRSSEESLRSYFGRFGEILSFKEFTVSNEASTKNVILSFRDQSSLDEVMKRPNSHKIDGRLVRCSRYQPKAFQGKAEFANEEFEIGAASDEQQYESEYELEYGPYVLLESAYHDQHTPETELTSNESKSRRVNSYHVESGDLVFRDERSDPRNPLQESFYNPPFPPPHGRGSNAFGVQSLPPKPCPPHLHGSKASCSSAEEFLENPKISAAQYLFPIEFEADPLFSIFCKSGISLKNLNSTSSLTSPGHQHPEYRRTSCFSK